jgi:endonuclease/exonuclease/phosphatase family metal-dependent hydrolase
VVIGVSITKRLLILLLVCSALETSNLSAQQQRGANPPLLTYSDLVELYENDAPAPALATKLDKVLSAPWVSNWVNGRQALPTKTIAGTQGDYLRVATWNIERGLEFEAVRAALTNDQKYFRRLTPSNRSKKFNLAQIFEQAKQLSRADVIVLNEVDWGLKRTDYRNVVKELALATKMNYAYGVEFVEVDPLTLGTETFEGEISADKAKMVQNVAVDKSKTLGLHGSAILSRLPLANVRIVRFVNQGHDWYQDEKNGVSKLEKGKRKGAGLVFGEKVEREVRRGGRMMLLADVSNQGIPGGKLTIVATHLEAKAKPNERVKQLEEVLSQVQSIKNPVVLAGDMNTSGSDATPTSFEREVKKRLGSSTFWATQGIKYATGVGLLYDVTIGLVKMQRLKNDPTVKSIKFVSENPEEKFFNVLKDYRFGDGGAFDFRGAKEFSTGASEETLSDSNERGDKGFVSTLELKGKITIELKLDWIFVKPAGLTDPDDRKQPYNFAPQYGRTLKALNYSLKDRISDHSPMIVDLPLNR